MLDDPEFSQYVDEIRARTQETDLSIPVREGDWWYYGRTVEGLRYRPESHWARRFGRV